MSIQAMAWAIEQQETKDPVTKLVLIVLANYAGADGCNAFPAIERLSRDTCLGQRTVQYHLKKLVQLVLIRKGNQSIAAAHIGRADRRPTVYDLLILGRGAPHAPRSSTGCTSQQNGVHMTTSRGALRAPNPILKSVREPKSAKEAVEDEIRERFGTVRSLARDLAQQKRVPK